MIFSNDFRLAYWPFLFIIALFPAFFYFWLKRNRPARIRLPLLVPKKARAAEPLKKLLILKLIALTFFVFALARPQSGSKQSERIVSGVDIMMVMDVSLSMNIEDLGEKSRIDIAKETIEQFIKGRENDRIGFLIFSGEPITMAPPTLDYGILIKALKESRTGLLKDGTAIGDGLALSVNRLKNSTAKSKVIILLTDGDNNIGKIDPATAGELAAGYGIRVYTIAIGKEGRVKMPITQPGIFGKPFTTYQWFDNALNPELLQFIAKTTGGKFFRVSDTDTLNSVFKEIDQLEKTEIKTHERIHYDERYQKPLKIGLFIFIMQLLISVFWWRSLP